MCSNVDEENLSLLAEIVKKKKKKEKKKRKKKYSSEFGKRKNKPTRTASVLLWILVATWIQPDYLLGSYFFLRL